MEISAMSLILAASDIFDAVSHSTNDTFGIKFRNVSQVFGQMLIVHERFFCEVRKSPWLNEIAVETETEASSLTRHHQSSVSYLRLKELPEFHDKKFLLHLSLSPPRYR